MSHPNGFEHIGLVLREIGVIRVENPGRLSSAIEIFRGVFLHRESRSDSLTLSGDDSDSDYLAGHRKVFNMHYAIRIEEFIVNLVAESAFDSIDVNSAR